LVKKLEKENILFFFFVPGIIHTVPAKSKETFDKQVLLFFCVSFKIKLGKIIVVKDLKEVVKEIVTKKN
jgi:hypothetical protein